MRFGELRFGLSRLAPFAAGLCLAATALTLSSAPAQARWHRHHRAHASQAASSTPAECDPSKYSAIVVDANTGRELWGVNENALRHPASITKVMTLYLLFEQLEKGNMTLSSRITISSHAAEQEPSKLGVAVGESISVEEAIKAIVTRSANDVAVAVAEAVGHDEKSFAALMTHRAHQLGMSRTLYRNASGLPNDEQLTTAHDLALLARSLQARFPNYYHYFSLHEFVYDGAVIGNHNHLLGRIEGVDGIKTGYTRASGFNLLTSVHRDGRSMVAVVMGGRSGPARDRLMERLIESHIADASPVRGSTRLAQIAPETYTVPVARGGARATQVADEEDVAEADAPAAGAEPQGEGDVSEDAAPLPPAPIRRLAAKPAPASPLLAKAAKLDPAKLGWRTGPKSKASARKSDDEETRVARNDESDDEAPSKPGKGDWIIQIGATDDADKARRLLQQAKSRNHALASARGFTEKVRRDGDTLYRVRFAGLDSGSAQRACRDLKHGGLPCFATQD
ncbi:MAG: D-alanyl-D-alanine carboxypeptidase [Pseudomonadota bacterium]|nr:D-alanyl-D-alanine carboxypeptidase [Pseudomonadota bacterium]